MSLAGCVATGPFVGPATLSEAKGGASPFGKSQDSCYALVTNITKQRDTLD